MKRKNKQFSIASLPLLGLGLFISLFLLSCSNSKTDVNEEQYKPFATAEIDENSVMARAFGDFDLFQPNIVVHKPEEDAGVQAALQKVESFKSFQETNLGSVSAKTNVYKEPSVSVHAIQKLTKCPIPRLNTTKPTITSSIEWQIFVYCVLDITPTNDGQEIVYPSLEKMDNFFSASNFLQKAKFAYQKKYFPLFKQSKLTTMQQYALFQRLFLVSKFRLPTPAEKQVAIQMIESLGIRFLSDAFVFNWFFSPFYARHFDFGKNPGQAYEPITISGSVQDDKGFPIDGVVYDVLNNTEKAYTQPFTLHGFKANGISQNSAIPTRKNNFTVQFYISTEKYFPFKWNIFHKDQAPKPFTVTLVMRKDGYAVTTQKMTLDKAKTDNIVIVMKKVPSEQVVTSWPKTDKNPNNPFLSIDFTPALKSKVDGCASPDTRDSGVVDGHNWQKFAYCVLEFSAFDSKFGINYYPLVTQESAFDMAFATKKQYLFSDRTIHQTDLQVLTKIYKLLSFKTPDSTLLKIMENAIATYGIDKAINQLLESWYNSTAYSTYFDYSKESFEGKTWVHFSGKITGLDGSPLSTTKNNAKVFAINSYGSFLQETLSQLPAVSDTGSFSLPLLINNREMSSPIVLTAQAEGYAPKEYVFKEIEKTEQTTNFILSPLGFATKTESGVIASPSRDVFIRIPAGAVSDDTTFALTNLSIVTTPSQKPKPAEENITTAEFTVTPGYQFHKPVTIEVKISESLRNALNAHENNLALFVKESSGKFILLEDSYYSLSSKTLSATTTHFSTFAIGQCGIIDCSGPVEVHPLASVLERQHIEYPTQLPQLKKEAVELLNAGGWGSSAINDVKNTTLQGCNDQSCPPTQVQLSQSELNIPTSYRDKQVNIDSIQLVSSKLTLTTQMDVQAEQCAINPKASTPQIRINAINATNASINVLLKFNNVKISYPCVKVRSYCFWLGCFGFPSLQTCHEPPFDHYVQYMLSGYNQSVLRDSKTASWKVGPTFSDGTYKVTVPDYVRTSKVKRIYAKQLENWFQKKLVISRDTVIRRTNQYLNTEFPHKPKFDKNNCFEAGPPVATVSSLSVGNIISNVGGTLANGEAIPSETTINWKSSRDGTFVFKINTVNGDCATGTALAGSDYSGTIHKNTINATTIYAHQLPKNGSNGVNICITDKYNGITGGTNVILRKAWMDNVCVVKPVVVNVCKTVAVRTCNNVKVGSHKTRGCWFRIGKWYDCYGACHFQGRCYSPTYKTVCTTKNEQQCADETQNQTTCTPQLRY